MEISSVKFIHLFRHNQEQLRKMQLERETYSNNKKPVFSTNTMLEKNKYE